MKYTLYIIAFLAVLMASFYFGYQYKGDNEIIRTDTLTITRIDTIRITEVKYIKEHIIDTINVPIISNSIHTDTIRINDTLFIQLPITQKLYADERYKAWVSGYRAKLDSIEVYQKTITNTIDNYIKPKRWTITAGVGYGISRNGLEPFVGVMAGYRIF
jgi:hypothetical protein